MRAIFNIRGLILICILSMLNLALQAQQTARFVNNWHVGDHVGISFNSGFPQNVTSSIDAYEVSTSFSDGYGNVICYSGSAVNFNQQVVFDADHLPMPNGDIYVDGSSSCGLTVVPKPGTCNQYYFFHLKSTQLGWGLHYSLLDMNLAGNGTNTNPLGDIDPLEKDVLIYGDDELAEKIKIVQQANTENYWVLVRSLTIDNFYAFEVTSIGINLVPVVSIISPTVWPDIQYSPIFGWLAIDKARSTLAESDGFGASVRLYDFNNTTGTLLLNELIDLGDWGVDIPYGVEFSPSGNVLYCSWLQGGTNSMVSSFDMNTAPGSVSATRIDNIISPGPNAEYGALTKAPDGKIYGSRSGMSELLVITEPENTGNPNILNPGHDPTPGQMSVGMPNLSYYFHPDHYIDELAGPDTIICHESQVELGYVGYDSIWVNYVWEPQAMISGSNAFTNPTTVPLNNDQEYVLHLVTACGDTVKTDTVAITIQLPELVLEETAETCLGQTIPLSVQSSGNILWSPAALVSESNQTETEFIGIESGFLYVEVTDELGCHNIDSIYVTVHSPPNADYATDILEGCTPLQVNFTDNSVPAIDDPIIDWQWYFDGADVITNNQQNPAIEFEGDFSDGNSTDSISVMLIVTSQAGCTDTLTVVNHIIVHENPTALFSLSPRVTDMNDPWINFTDLSSVTAYMWNWDFGNGYGSTLQNPTFLYTEDGIYQITLIIETIDGCTASITDSVIIKPPFSFYIPNSFTPNNDGDNDSFGGYGVGIADYEMTVLNRWGEEIFYSTNLSAFWDGTFKGKKVELATYTYKCAIIDINGETHHYLGSVTLIR